MSESRYRDCSRCGELGTTVMLPTGPICYRCRRRLAYHPIVCPECFELRPVAYASTSSYGVLVCAACAGEKSVFACAECGREDHPYGAERCARCILAERLTALLTDPATGKVRTPLQPLFDELMSARRPQSVITWLKKPPATGARLLALMARGELPITHDTFRALPADRSHNYLRELLTSTGILPAYQPPIEQIERWLTGILEPVDPDSAAVISRYAHWHHLRRLRGLAEHGALTKTSIYAARGNINGATRLAHWAARNGTTLDALTQAQLDCYLAEHPGGRTSQQTFVAWLRRSRTNTRISIPWRAETAPEVVVSDADRWNQINQLLHDDATSLYVRIGGLFTLLFAQPLQTVIAMRTDQVALEPDGRVLVTFDTIPIEMPPDLDILLRRHLDNRGTPSIVSSEHGWLFPGRHPGRHLVRETFRGHLVAVGIRPGHSRHAAMFALASEVPAPVLAELIGIADKTAAKWAALAGRDWAEYVTQRDH